MTAEFVLAVVDDAASDFAVLKIAVNYFYQSDELDCSLLRIVANYCCAVLEVVASELD